MMPSLSFRGVVLLSGIAFSVGCWVDLVYAIAEALR